MKLPSWQPGRQGTGYEVLTLISSKLFKFDLHVIRYRQGSSIPTHTDPAQSEYEHHRLNIVLKKAKKGGEYKDDLGRLLSRVIKFRPDITPHGVTEILEGTRYVLSIGWLKKEKK